MIIVRRPADEHQVWPHPFFKRDVSATIYPFDVLAREERDALRPLCGSHPTAKT
ncbi:MAG: hypothetical protein ABSG88_10665 [Bradyrhizobium sp.]